MNKEAVLNNIQLAQQGDETAKELIVKNNLGLVWSIVHRFKNNYYDKEDLFYIVCIGIMKAINNFDVHYGVQFSRNSKGTGSRCHGCCRSYRCFLLSNFTF